MDALVREICAFFAFNEAFLFEFYSSSQRIACLRVWKGFGTRGIKDRRALDSPALRAVLASSGFEGVFTEGGADALAAAFARPAPPPAGARVLHMDCRPQRRMGIAFFPAPKNGWSSHKDELLAKAVKLLSAFAAREVLGEILRLRMEDDDFLAALQNVVFRYGTINEEVLVNMAPLVFERFNIGRILIYGLSEHNNALDAIYDIEAMPSAHPFPGASGRFNAPRKYDLRALPHTRALLGTRELSMSCDTADLSEADRAFFQTFKAGAFLKFSMGAVNKSLLRIIFLDTAGPHLWSDDDIGALGRCARVFFSILVRLNARRALESTVKVNALVKDIYEIAITREDRAEVLPDILRAVCEYYNLDRAFVFRISPDMPVSLHNTAVSCYVRERQGGAVGVEPDQALVRMASVVRQARCFCAGQTEGYTGEELDTLMRHGIMSACLLPLLFDNNYQGFLVFDSLTSFIAWDSRKISVLQSVARIVSHEVMHQEHNRGLSFIAGLYNQTMTSGDIISSINTLLGKIRDELDVDEIYLTEVCDRGSCMHTSLPHNFSCPNENCRNSPFGFLRQEDASNGIFICNNVDSLEPERAEALHGSGVSAYVAMRFNLAGSQRSLLAAVKRSGAHAWTYRQISGLRSYAAAIGSLWLQVAGEYAKRGKMADQEFINETYALATSEGEGAALASSILRKLGEYLNMQRSAIYSIIDQDRASLLIEHAACGFAGLVDRSYALYTGRIQSLFDDVSAGRPSHCPDTAALGPLEREFYKKIGVGSYYALPLVAFGQMKHFITGGYADKGRTWTEREKQLFESVAHILEATFMRKEMEERLSREKSQQLADQKFINEVYALITGGDDRPQSITKVMGKICSYFGMHKMRVYCYRNFEEPLICEYYYNEDQSKAHIPAISVKEAERLLSRRRPNELIYCQDLTTLSEEEQVFLKSRGVCGFCTYIIPSVDGTYRSVAVFATRPTEAWSEREIALYKTLARILDDTIARIDIENTITLQKRQAIAGVYREISNAKTTYEMMRRALSSIRKVMELDRVSIYEVPYTGGDGEHELAYLSYYDFDREKKASAPIDWFFVSDLAKLKRGLSTDISLAEVLASNAHNYVDSLPYDNMPKLFAIAPVYSGSKLLGAICFSHFSEGRELSAQDIVNLEIAVHVVETALERKRTEEFIFYRAYYDSLLNIPNRLSAEKYLGALLESCKSGCLALIDLDDFKSINELAGYTVGDALLREFCAFLQRLIAGKGRIFRFGGDEFLIIYEEVDLQALQADLDAIVDRCRTVWNARNEYHYCTASIGTVFFPEYGVVAENLLESAAIAMHNAKRHGKNKISNFSISLTESLRRQYEIEQALRSALEKGFKEFHVYFQPIIAANTCKVTGCEALLRFKNKKLGLVSSDAVISVAERLRVISAIGEHVLHTAFRACRGWHEAGHNFSVNINVSVVQFQHGDLLECVQRALRDTGCDPRWVVLEITETIAMREVEKILRIVSKLRAMGIRIALDDFGSGYFSFSTLSNIPLDVIKIDRTFTKNIDTDDFSRNFVRSIVSLAHSNGKKVCVEGVETASQDMLVKKMGVDYIQGFLYSRPLPSDQFPGMFEDGRADFSSTMAMLPAEEYDSYDELHMLRNQLRIKSQQVESFLRSADGFVFEYRPESRNMLLIYIPPGWTIAGTELDAFSRHTEIDPEAFGRQVHSEDLRRFWLEMERSHANPGDLRESLIRIRASGAQHIWASMRLSTFYDNELGCYRTMAVCTDIDDQVRVQKELEAHSKRFHSLLEATDSFIWESREGEKDSFKILAKPGSWVSDEERVCNLDGSGIRPVDDRHLTGLVHPDDLPRARVTLEEAFKNPYKRYEMLIRMRVFDHEYRMIMTKMLTYHTAGGALCCIGNSMDVTEALESRQAATAAGA